MNPPLSGRLLRLIVMATVSLIANTCMAATPANLAWQVVGPEGDVVLRWLTQAPHCPVVQWSSGRIDPLRERVGPAPASGTESFDDRVCETMWPRNETAAIIEGQALATPYRAYRRIALIGDTGCRRKAADHAFQNCDSPDDWPFALVAQAVLDQSPDLVVHVGDITYRESPCPEASPCSNPAWGYGSDVWAADLFAPAGSLLRSVPWVFVRGNHESCERAGQGWFRYIDPRTYVTGQSCDADSQARIGNFTLPYRVPLQSSTQLLILDSAASGNKPRPGEGAPEQAYVAQLELARKWITPARHTWIASHHPFFAMAPGPGGDRLQSGHSRVLALALDAFGATGLRQTGVEGFLHGHIHAFEAMDFQEPLPFSLVVGNSGSQMEGQPPAQVPAGYALQPGAHINHYASQPGFGFALLEFADARADEAVLTEFDVHGQPLARCRLGAGNALCTAVPH